MSHRNKIMLFLVLIFVFLLGFPGAALAQENTTQKSNNSITLEVPEQAETGQAITIIAKVMEKEYSEPLEGVPVDFFIAIDFFINDLVEIGEAVTDKSGIAKLDYVPNQPGEILVVANFKEGADFVPVVAQSTVRVSGETKPVYRTVIGIQFPHSLIIWLSIVVLVISIVYGFFMFVIYQVNRISIGSGAKSLPFILMIVVTVLYIIIVLVLVTQEAQFNFGLLP